MQFHKRWWFVIEKLECNDFELEFLKVFGIELIGYKFINTKTDKEFIFFSLPKKSIVLALFNKNISFVAMT